ncbi:MAG: WecB/TagA/CpsF family glycosyltransferase [Patescibacteria group bacterium]
MNLLGVKIDNLSIEEALEKIEGFLGDVKSPLTPLLQSGEEEGASFTKRGGNQHYIVLPYADFLVQAQKNEEFKRILNEADLSLSDGIGPIAASYLFGKERLKGRVMGVDLIGALFAKFGVQHGIFLFGAKEGVAQEVAAKLILAKAPLSGAAKIAGTLNGYVSDEEAIDAINNSNAEILLVGLGMPKQEKWIYNNLKRLPAVKIAIGVGGALDFISGRVRRAPRFVQKIGLEWLWRLFVRPSQWRKTWRSVAVFSWLIIKSLFQCSQEHWNNK